MDVNMIPMVTDGAIRMLEGILYESGEPYRMKLAKLAIRSSWHLYYARHLGKPKAFLLKHPDIFHVISGRGAGNDEVELLRGVRAIAPVLSLHPQPSNHLPPPVRRSGPPPLIPALLRASSTPRQNEEEGVVQSTTIQVSQLTRSYDSHDPPQIANPVPYPDQAIFNEEADLELCRDFDSKDDFYDNKDRCLLIEQNRRRLWDREFCSELAHSPLKTFAYDDARIIYDQAYNKCTRLSVRISNVHQSISQLSLRLLLKEHAKKCENEKAELFLFKDDNNTGKIFSLTYATMWCPGRGGDATAAFDYVVDLLKADAVQMDGSTLGLFNNEVGNSPCISAVRITVKELIEERNGTNGTIFAVASRGDITVDSAPTSPLPHASLWPTEYAFPHLYMPVVDPKQNRIVAKAIEALYVLERSLRSECERQAILNPNEQENYLNPRDHKVEWWADEHNKLGCGAEACVYAGLLSCDYSNSNEKQLVAVKHKFHGTDSLFNSQERDHLINLRGLPGVVKYYDGFRMKDGSMKHEVLVQDIGCMSLSQLIHQDADEKAKGAHRSSVLQPSDFFRITKAVAMAVEVLHNQTPSVVHRDLRPENVLIMPNGTLCLTDFGLARRKKVFAGASVHTRVRLTTMQPYEVQKMFTSNACEMQELSVSHSGDIFMLGCVIAFVNMGKQPFDDDKIYNRGDPDLDDTLLEEKPWLCHLLRQMLSHDHAKRPSIDMVLRHPFFKTHEQNFSGSLISRIEHCIVNDFKGADPTKGPIDNAQFRLMEKILRPIEDELLREKADGCAWHNILPQALFHGESSLPFSRVPIAFQGSNRPFPLPEVAKLVKWLRNVHTHLHSAPALQDLLRRSKPGDTHYATAGEFFMKHPAVREFLPRVWEQHLKEILKSDVIQRDMAIRYQKEINDLEDSREKVNRLLN